MVIWLSLLLSAVTNWSGSMVNKLLTFVINVTVGVNNVVQYELS